MNQDELNAIRERVDAATSGPWKEKEFVGSQNFHMIVPGRHPHAFLEDGFICDLISKTADMHFIAHAREDVPALLDEIDRLRAAMRAVEWVPPSGFNDSICPWCQQASQFGHASNCQRQVALHEPLEVPMLTDEQLANELVGTCPRCGRTLRLHWQLQDGKSIRVCVRHPKPGTKGMVQCRGSNLPPAEDDVT